MSITNRQMLILKAIVDEYILTGMPVGSRTLSKKEYLDFSSATIRNDMADLEESGYLMQPHTSAGRAPSQKAYRLYVDTLMHVSALDGNEIEFIRTYLNARMTQMESIMDVTAKMLSELTNLTALVIGPRSFVSTLRRVQIVRINEKRALIVFVFNTGEVRNMQITVSEEIDDSYFEVLSNMLTQAVANKTVSEAVVAIKNSLSSEMQMHADFMESLLDAAVYNLDPQGGKEIVFGGAKNMLNHPEYQDIHKAQSFLSLLETKETLYDLMQQTAGMEFTIKIGQENDVEELKDMSVVTASYSVSGDRRGSFGIIGPTRMNYARILSVLQYVGASLNEIFEQHLDDE